MRQHLPVTSSPEQAAPNRSRHLLKRMPEAECSHNNFSFHRRVVQLSLIKAHFLLAPMPSRRLSCVRAIAVHSTSASVSKPVSGATSAFCASVMSTLSMFVLHYGVEVMFRMSRHFDKLDFCLNEL